MSVMEGMEAEALGGCRSSGGGLTSRTRRGTGGRAETSGIQRGQCLGGREKHVSQGYENRVGVSMETERREGSEVKRFPGLCLLFTLGRWGKLPCEEPKEGGAGRFSWNSYGDSDDE